MGHIKDGYDIVKDISKGISNRQKVKRLIDNMILSIESNTAEEDFYHNYNQLIDLIKYFKWKDKDMDYKKKYIKIKEYYKKHWGEVSFTI